MPNMAVLFLNEDVMESAEYPPDDNALMNDCTTASDASQSSAPHRFVENYSIFISSEIYTQSPSNVDMNDAEQGYLPSSESSDDDDDSN